MAPVRELRERLRLPIEERPDYITLAGFALFTLGSVPRPGVSFAAGGYAWTVVDTSGPRIVTVKVARAGAAPSPSRSPS
jgi:CBS domain containing-hemolysin-like protein